MCLNVFHSQFIIIIFFYYYNYYHLCVIITFSIRNDLCAFCSETNLIKAMGTEQWNNIEYISPSYAVYIFIYNTESIEALR